MRSLYFLPLALGLLACSPTTDMEGEVVALGDFKLGHLVARTTDEMTKGPFSRDASNEEWSAALDVAFKNRFARYSGDEIYHLGVTAEAYVLAQPGIPVVAAPKSILIFNVVVIENSTRSVLTPEGHQLTVIETLGGQSLLGTGFTMTKEEQLANLAEEAARAAEKWLRTQDWFTDGKAGVIGIKEN